MMTVYLCKHCGFEETAKESLPNINKVCKNCDKISSILHHEDPKFDSTMGV